MNSLGSALSVTQRGISEFLCERYGIGHTVIQMECCFKSMFNSSFNHSHVDRLGACVSTACAIHCAILPFGMTVLPLLGVGFIADERIERIVLVMSLVLASASICWGLRIHRRWRILLPFLGALLCILVGRGLMTGLLEVVFVVVGTSLFVLAHLLNQKLCQACKRCGDEE